MHEQKYYFLKLKKCLKILRKASFVNYFSESLL